jgi:hypothetical protein
MARRLGIVLLAALAMAAMAAPARAVGPFGPAVTVVDLGCNGTDFNVSKAALGGDGIVRGWTVANGAGCGDDRVWFYQGAGRSWTRERSPYRGRILAATFDGTGAYLLYLSSDGVHLAKRTPSGTFTGGRLLSGSTYSAAEGAVTATGGSWWAVWSEQTDVDRYGAPLASLFQAKTYGTDQVRQRITFERADDRHPDLAPRPGGGAVLVWTRDVTEFPVSTSVRVATSTDGRWTSRAFATAGEIDQVPQVTTDGRWTYVAWERDRHVVEADNTSGSFRSHRFVTAGSSPSVAVSRGRTFVTWITRDRSGTTHPFVAERVGATWTGLHLPRTTPGGYELGIEVTAHLGSATVLILNNNDSDIVKLYARSQG